MVNGIAVCLLFFSSPWMVFFEKWKKSEVSKFPVLFPFYEHIPLSGVGKIFEKKTNSVMGKIKT